MPPGADPANHDLVKRVKLHFMDSIKFTEQQVSLLHSFRAKWYDSIQEAFQSNSKVVELLTQLHKQQIPSAVMHYQSLVNTVREEFFEMLSLQQKAKIHVWLHR